MAFAKLFFDEQWCAVREPYGHTRLGWVYDCRVEHLDFRPAAVITSGFGLRKGGMAEVHLGNSRDIARARIVMRILNLAAPQRYCRVAPCACAQHDQYIAPFGDILSQR